jgi:ATPase subunit of ABC transporter with duplicated ATPase domains
MRDIDPGFYDMVRRSDQNLDGIIVELIKGKLNFGEATHAAQLEYERFNQEGKAFAQRIEANLHQQHNAEMAQRQAAYAQQQAAQAQSEANMAAFGAAMSASSAQFLQGQQQLLQATTNFQPPQVTPITPLGGGSQTRCINTAIGMNCRSY